MAKENEIKEPLTKQPIGKLEASLWKSADKLRKNIDAAEYKHVVLGLILLKYISDAFDELYDKLKADESEYAGADPEDKDEYKAENVFFVPEKARWTYLLSQAKQPTIGKSVDEAMDKREISIAQIQDRIFTFRGQQVMIDRDLAEMYDVEVKRLNEQVKRNSERFPESFRFQLNKQEKDELVANCDRFESLKHSSQNSYLVLRSRIWARNGLPFRRWRG